MRPKLTFANVISAIALFIALGGTGLAASQLGKNSVGSKQLKKSAVTTAKIKNEAVTAAKVKKGTLTGAQINSSTLGAVPAADTAQTARIADTAQTARIANTAQTANTANSLAPSEPWHEVDAPGEPKFLNSWSNDQFSASLSAAFFKDHEGIVHLKGFVTGGTAGPVFLLPPGFRPAAGKAVVLSVPCFEGGCGAEAVKSATIWGPSAPSGTSDAVEIPPGAKVSLDSITFRAES